MRSSTRPTMIDEPNPRVCMSFPSEDKSSHAPISVECLLSMTPRICMSIHPEDKSCSDRSHAPISVDCLFSMTLPQGDLHAPHQAVHALRDWRRQEGQEQPLRLSLCASSLQWVGVGWGDPSSSGGSHPSLVAFVILIGWHRNQSRNGQY